MKIDKRKKKARLNQLRHAQHRAMERFSVCVDENRINLMIKELQQNKMKYIGKVSNRITVYETQLDDQPCRAIYDKETKMIVTFLPMHYNVGGIKWIN